MRPIIFYEGIITPPSESLAIRSVCLYFSIFIKKDVDFLLEVEKENKDFYYNWLKKTGLKDFISEMIEPEEKVIGLRISEEPKQKPCLKINRVTWDNIEHVLNILKYN
tara:strand:- start:142 stop:465 length:324 start_codon:yes stop_codon:yes gene_type:complete